VVETNRLRIGPEADCREENLGPPTRH